MCYKTSLVKLPTVPNNPTCLRYLEINPTKLVRKNKIKKPRQPRARIRHGGWTRILNNTHPYSDDSYPTDTEISDKCLTLQSKSFAGLSASLLLALTSRRVNQTRVTPPIPPFGLSIRAGWGRWADITLITHTKIPLNLEKFLAPPELVPAKIMTDVSDQDQLKFCLKLNKLLSKNWDELSKCLIVRSIKFRRERTHLP